jgi:hypothetical protein
MAEYKRFYNCIVRRSDGAIVPLDESNRDYREYLEWIDRGNIPDHEEVNLRLHVDLERDRRINGGFAFEGVQYQSRDTDRENIAGAAQLGFMAIVAGAQAGDLRWHGGSSDFQWIALDNSRVDMDAQTVVEFGKAAATYKQELVFAGSNLKEMTPIPADYTDDRWWTA